MNWTLYFFVKLDEIKILLSDISGALFPLGFLCLFALILLYWFFYIEEEKEPEKQVKNAIFIPLFMILFAFFTVILNAFVPSTGQMAAIYFGDAALKSETAEIMKRMPPKLANILENELDEYLSQQLNIKNTKNIKEKIQTGGQGETENH